MKIRFVGYPVDVGVAASLNPSDDALVALWNPAVARPPGLAVAFLDVAEDSHGVFHPDACHGEALRADAYAGEFDALRKAIEWLKHRPAPSAESVHTLTYLGALGVHALRMPIGARFVVRGETRVGRSESCEVNVRHGSHSDQNVCARVHAILKPAEGGVHVLDAKSSNGTFVDGVLGDEFVARVGQEIAFAGCFRFRVG